MHAVGRRHALQVLNVVAARETAHFNEISVVVNWFEDLKRLVQIGKR